MLVALYASPPITAKIGMPDLAHKIGVRVLCSFAFLDNDTIGAGRWLFHSRQELKGKASGVSICCDITYVEYLHLHARTKDHEHRTLSKRKWWTSCL